MFILFHYLFIYFINQEPITLYNNRILEWRKIMGRVAKLTVQGHTYLQSVLEQELESKFLTLCSELFCLHSASF